MTTFEIIIFKKMTVLLGRMLGFLCACTLSMVIKGISLAGMQLFARSFMVAYGLMACYYMWLDVWLSTRPGAWLPDGFTRYGWDTERYLEALFLSTAMYFC